ncbi:MAG: fructose-6-phosphate aldolase [Bacteroidia bacterium]|nr:fructose-6-phosphate aldolase [Bacteroidia bacterium]MDW8302596.1 fructose-6-phosphate aldolase [Bacteroidia bacterium]
MKFFIDTANLKHIEEAASMGILDGVTTNPSLMAKEGVKNYEQHYKTICALLKELPVSAEVIATDLEGMIKEGSALAEIADNIVIKIPLTKSGIKAIQYFHQQGVKTNCTLCFSATQALIAAKAGATYISPFIGRLDDISTEGMQLIEQIRTIYDNYGFATEILAASIRHPLHVLQAALVGADVATMPFSVIEQLFRHPLTDIGLEKFLADHQKNLL